MYHLACYNYTSKKFNFPPKIEFILDHLIIFVDDSVISGSLIWSRAPVVTPRSIADFRLSLTLDLSRYSNISLNSVINMPGMLMFGDETRDDHISMNVSHSMWLEMIL